MAATATRCAWCFAAAVRSNMSIDTDVLSAGSRPPTVRRSFLRYTA